MLRIARPLVLPLEMHKTVADVLVLPGRSVLQGERVAGVGNDSQAAQEYDRARSLGMGCTARASWSSGGRRT